MLSASSSFACGCPTNHVLVMTAISGCQRYTWDVTGSAAQSSAQFADLPRQSVRRFMVSLVCCGLDCQCCRLLQVPWRCPRAGLAANLKNSTSVHVTHGSASILDVSCLLKHRSSSRIIASP